MAKSLLNNLLGRFGINLEKPTTKLMDSNTFYQKSLMYKINSYKTVSENKVLVTYIPKLDPEVIKGHGLDLVKIANKFKDNELQGFSFSSVVISAAITAYARIHMAKLKLDILNNGADVYYTDTDSIVTNKELPKDMVDAKALGKLKLEHKIDKAIFISGKLYCIYDDKGNFINKVKGINSSSLSYFDYVKLLNNSNINTTVKMYSQKDWTLGQVTIGEKNVTLNSNSYTKRTKLFENNTWVDTKPNLLNITSQLAITHYETKNNLMSFIYYVIDKISKTFWAVVRSDLYISICIWLFFVICFIAYLLSVGDNYEGENEVEVEVGIEAKEVETSKPDSGDSSVLPSTSKMWEQDDCSSPEQEQDNTWDTSFEDLNTQTKSAKTTDNKYIHPTNGEWMAENNDWGLDELFTAETTKSNNVSRESSINSFIDKYDYERERTKTEAFVKNLSEIQDHTERLTRENFQKIDEMFKEVALDRNRFRNQSAFFSNSSIRSPIDSTQFSEVNNENQANKDIKQNISGLDANDVD